MDYETAYRWLHGDRVEYSGGLDDLCGVTPIFDAEQGLIVLETTQHESGARR